MASHGLVNPSVKNLGNTANEWRALQTFTRNNLGGTTTQPAIVLQNTVAATSSSQASQQVSPAHIMTGRGWKTSATAGSHTVGVRQWVQPESGTTTARPIYKLDTSIDGTTWVNVLSVVSGNASYLTTPISTWTGKTIISFTASDSAPNLNDHLTLENPSGSWSHMKFNFTATPKGTYSVSSSGQTIIRSIASTEFHIGTSIGAASAMVQVSSVGIYNYGGSFNTGRVTAGQPDTTPPAFLNTYGSFAGKGTLVTASTYTLAANDFVIYGDADTAFLCSGTPSVTTCSTYTGSGEATCESHNGCTWNAGTACSTYNGTDEATCESGHSPCVFDEVSCGSASNTDQTTCEALDDTYGGTCAWDESTCPAQGTQGACEANAGCTWNFSACSAFNNSDQGTCEANTGCTWTAGAFDCHTLDATDEGTCTAVAGCQWDNGGSTCFNICEGQYNTSCTGSLCSGTYFNGNCSGGSWGVGCTGTVTCSGYVTSGTCLAEAGCTGSAGSTWTLPVSTEANKSNTSRFYHLKNIGVSGTIVVNAGSGDTLESPLTLNPSDAAMVHHHNKTASCSGFGSEGACTPSGCSWVPAVVCSDYNGDESGCNDHAANGCSYSDPTCSGAGTAAFCTGTYTASKVWYLL